MNVSNFCDLEYSKDLIDSEIIHKKYCDYYDNEIQGCCILIADEIHNVIGGEIVAGELTWNGGSYRRTHWWVNKDNQIVDPMGYDLLKYEACTNHVEIHRNIGIFLKIIPEYEKWRI